MRRAYSYQRFSSERQSKGDSLRRQTKLATEWCTAHPDVILDLSLRPDEGISALEGANAETGQLSVFLAMVKAGDVEPGSILLIENLDRLTRNVITEAAALFLSIVNSGITIVVLQPREEILDRKTINETPYLIFSVMNALILAHEESAKKGKRSRENWENKRSKIGEKPLTRKLPAWVEFDGKKLVSNANAALVRRIYEMAENGMGTRLIARQLNKERIPTMGYGKFWNASYVRLILTNAAVMGHFQARSKGKPVGEVVTDYYPAVIPEDQFNRVQSSLEQRTRAKGRPGEDVNIFKGLLKDARDGRNMICRWRHGNGLLVSAGAFRGEPGSKYITMPYDIVERGFFCFVEELTPADLASPTNHNERATLRDKLAALERDIAKIKATYDKNPESENLLEMIVKREREKRVVQQQIEQLKRRSSASPIKALEDVQSMLDVLETADRAMREKIAVRVRRLVSEMRLIVYGHNGHKLGLCQVYFDNDTVRQFVITLDSEFFGEPVAIGGRLERQPLFDLRKYDGEFDRSPYDCIDDYHPRMTAQQKERLAALVKTDKPTAEIANEVGVCTETVRRAKRKATQL